MILFFYYKGIFFFNVLVADKCFYIEFEASKNVGLDLLPHVQPLTDFEFWNSHNFFFPTIKHFVWYFIKNLSFES